MPSENTGHFSHTPLLFTKSWPRNCLFCQQQEEPSSSLTLIAASFIIIFSCEGVIAIHSTFFIFNFPLLLLPVVFVPRAVWLQMAYWCLCNNPQFSFLSLFFPARSANVFITCGKLNLLKVKYINQ